MSKLPDCVIWTDVTEVGCFVREAWWAWIILASLSVSQTRIRWPLAVGRFAYVPNSRPGLGRFRNAQRGID